MNNEKEIIFWGAGTARTFRPIWMAEELGLSYILKPIGPRTGETQTKEFTSLNRKQNSINPSRRVSFNREFGNL